MSDTRSGYYSEQVRNDAYLKIVEDDRYLNEKCKIILKALVNRGGRAIMAELSEDTGIPIHLVSARMNDLVALKAVRVNVVGFELVKGKQRNIIEKKLNPATNIHCTVWYVNDEAFNRLGGLGFGVRKERGAA